MAKVTILRRASLKESVIPIQFAVPIGEVLNDVTFQISTLEKYHKFLNALNSDLSRVLLYVSQSAGVRIYEYDVEEVKLIRGNMNPIVVLRTDKGKGEGVISYDGTEVKFELDGRELRFEMLNRR